MRRSRRFSRREAAPTGGRARRAGPASRSARAYLRDVPAADLHLFDTGHFALEQCLPEIAPLIADFLDRTWR